MKKITLFFTLIAVSFGFAQGSPDCATAEVVTPGTYTGDIVGDDVSGNGDDTWYTYTPGANGTVTITVCADPDDPDTDLYLFDGSCAALNQIGADDDGCAGTFESLLVGVPVVSGTQYWIQYLDTWDEIEFDWELIFTPCVPPTATATVVDNCGGGDYTIDVEVTDMGDSATLTISTDFDPTTYPVVAPGTTNIGPFPLLTAVNITISHESNTDCDIFGGPFIDGCPPANDECTTAIALNCDDTVAGSTVLATDSGGNPAFDVWYSYTTTILEDVTVSLCGSGYDTAIRVFSDCPATNEVLFNDDFCGLQSEGTFTADGSGGSATYYIMVEGFGSSTGTFTLNLACVPNVPAPPNDLCANQIPLTLDVPLTGQTTAGATDDSTGGTDDTTCDSFQFHSDVWYTFVAADTDVSIVTTITGTSDQANVAVYSSIDCSQLDVDSIACSDGNGGESLDVTGLTATNTYYVRVWSDGVALAAPMRAEGTFDITINNALLGTESFDVNGFEYFPNPVNDNLTLRSLSNIQNVAVYNMLGQEVMKVTPNAVDAEVDMKNLSQGAYFVKVTINNVTNTIRIIKK